MTTEEEYDLDCDEPAVVLDNGSYSIQAGYAGDTLPTYEIRSVVGKPRPTRKHIMPTTSHKDVYVGNEAISRRGLLTLKYPIERGIVTNWDDMEKIWHSTLYNELRVAPEEKQVIITETPLTPKANREKKTQIMFETFNVPRFYITMSSVTALYSMGRTTGTMIESGYEVTHCTPIYEGYPLPHAIYRIYIGGRNITDYLVTNLKQDCGFGMVFGHSSDAGSSERDICKEIKEKLCYVALDFDDEIKKSQNSSSIYKTYELPDGQTITFNSNRFKSCEILFDPLLIGSEEDGMHKLTQKSILKCDPDIRKDLYGNICVSGGNSKFHGIDSRLQKEMNKLKPQWMCAKIICPPERKWAAWTGASILASLSTFTEYWITKEEYDESGPSIVHRKCT